MRHQTGIKRRAGEGGYVATPSLATETLAQTEDAVARAAIRWWLVLLRRAPSSLRPPLWQRRDRNDGPDIAICLYLRYRTPGGERRLRAGMYVNVRITAPMPETWVLPANAVVKQADQTVVFLHRDGKAIRLAIQPGRSDGGVVTN